MSYELCNIAGRTCHANEYRNTSTGELEVLRFYGAYRIQETFLMPDGDVLLLAFDKDAAYPHVIGVYGKSVGVYREDGTEARRYFTWRIAESFGLVVDKEGSTTVVPASREHATDLVKQIKQDCAEWDGGEVDAAVAGDRLAEHASSLGKHLQRIGVLSAPVFENWEAVG
ncbi:hypothetical protein [Streptomyces sp. NPDC056921]|uniref:hypothetical protein n=1 Tax=Streptomyces sp. NPDC056921 TaxID=3345966 RepID=UPI003641A845